MNWFVPEGVCVYHGRPLDKRMVIVKSSEVYEVTQNIVARVWIIHSFRIKKRKGTFHFFFQVFFSFTFDSPLSPTFDLSAQ